jgi:hypothetical protein
MSTVRRLDKAAVLAAAAETGHIVTVEEHTVFGGLGGAVAELVVTNHPVPMRILGVPGVFTPTGSAEWLLEHFGLTAQGICDAALPTPGLCRADATAARAVRAAHGAAGSRGAVCRLAKRRGARDARNDYMIRYT